MTQRRGQRILEDKLTKEILTRWDSLDEKEKDDQEREKVHREMEKGKIKRKEKIHQTRCFMQTRGSRLAVYSNKT